VTIGDRGLKEGFVEYQHRRDAQAKPIAVGDVFNYLHQAVGLALAN